MSALSARTCAKYCATAKGREERKEIAKLIKALEPQVSNRQIAKAVGVDERTVRRDAAEKDEKPKENSKGTRRNAAPTTGAAAARAVLQRDEYPARHEARLENIRRRHLTQSQIAMLTAMVYPKPGHKSRPDSKMETESVHSARLCEARKVLHVLPELAHAVAAGPTSLQEAYEAALAHEKKIKQEQADLEQLRKEARSQPPGSPSQPLSTNAAGSRPARRRASACRRRSPAAPDQDPSLAKSAMLRLGLDGSLAGKRAARSAARSKSKP